MSIHIFRGLLTTTELEVAQLNKFDKYQKRYLKKICCRACGLSLDNYGCGDVLAESCSESARIRRRDEALKRYKPKINQRKQDK